MLRCQKKYRRKTDEDQRILDLAVNSALPGNGMLVMVSFGGHLSGQLRRLDREGGARLLD